MYKEEKWFKVVIGSLLLGLVAIPIHECGHLIFSWLSGEAGWVTYAKNYTFSGRQTFIGILGGPVFPLLIAYCLLIYQKRNGSSRILTALGIILFSDRWLLYLSSMPHTLYGVTGYDENTLAEMTQLPGQTFICLFFLLEMLGIGLLLKNVSKSIKERVIIFSVAILSFLVSAYIGLTYIAPLWS